MSFSSSSSSALPASSSSSALPEKIRALTNNQRVLLSKNGLAMAIVATGFGGLIISKDHALVLAPAVAVACYREKEKNKWEIEEKELLARTLGIRLRVVELRGRSAPLEGMFGFERVTASVVYIG